VIFKQKKKFSFVLKTSVVYKSLKRFQVFQIRLRLLPKSYLSSTSTSSCGVIPDKTEGGLFSRSVWKDFKDFGAGFVSIKGKRPSLPLTPFDPSLPKRIAF
jgi:hypothetical protein